MMTLLPPSVRRLRSNGWATSVAESWAATDVLRKKNRYPRPYQALDTVDGSTSDRSFESRAAA